MVINKVEKTDEFVKAVTKIKDGAFKEKVEKQIIKIIREPEIGKPMRFGRQGTREVYLSPYRLAYAYVKEENKIIFIGLYHKDQQ